MSFETYGITSLIQPLISYVVLRFNKVKVLNKFERGYWNFKTWYIVI